ncbi:PPE family protein [Mycobacterium vicinigordonae]|uniref:PPE family protein n=1 Tax=Mycobacterium vicinigordonae TaxID=1719132 RepID=A0A7D6DUM3_9MYCO|nr:PPE family protein [Mycobacterium vicinigordonae]QLL05048.1 PPE family protein [Mycobacterium vicinigordonae]
MTAPVWMAAPPEVHSTLLSSGAGPGSLLAAAAAWNALGAEYAAVAAELSAALAAVQGSSWQGPTAAAHATAHVPYLAWLTRMSADSARAATRHEVAAGAYSAALAAMPTMAELAANHAMHGVLIATNFFGINTIPIAINEADYVRMWIQAATTMSVYQAVSSSALASATPTDQSPRILAAEAAPAEPATTPPTDPIEELLAWSEHFTSMYRALKGLILDPVGTVIRLITDFATNPVAAVTTWMPLIYVFLYAATFAVMGTPIYNAIAAPFGVIPLALALCTISVASEVPAALVAEAPPVPAEQQVTPVASVTPAMTTAGVPPTPSSLPSQAPAATATAAAPPPSGFQGFAYLVGGAGPGPTMGPPLRTRASASAPASGITAASAASAAASARAKARRRRRGDVKNRGYRDEYLTLDDTPDWTPDEQLDNDVAGSDAGAGPLGFTGTAMRSRVREAAGLTTLAGDSFTDAPTVPMMPGSWGGDPDGARPSAN